MLPDAASYCLLVSLQIATSLVLLVAHTCMDQIHHWNMRDGHRFPIIMKRETLPPNGCRRLNMSPHNPS